MERFRDESAVFVDVFCSRVNALHHIALRGIQWRGCKNKSLLAVHHTQKDLLWFLAFGLWTPLLGKISGGEVPALCRWTVEPSEGAPFISSINSVGTHLELESKFRTCPSLRLADVVQDLGEPRGFRLKLHRKSTLDLKGRP